MTLDFPSAPTNGQQYQGYVYDTAKGVWSHFDYLSGVSLLGTVYGWPLEDVPSWALELDGQAVSRTTYSGLFALLGTTYGAGDGSTTFNLPDYRGRTLVGRDTGQTEFDVVGETGGAKTHTLTTTEMPSHAHDIRTKNDDFNFTSATAGVGPTFADAKDGINTFNNFSGIVQATGGGGAHNNLQPYAVVKWIICATTSTGDFNTEVQTALVTRVSDTPLSQNFILNGAFDIWQRGTSSLIGSNVYCADRWIQTRSASTTLVVSRSTDVPAGQPLQYSALFSVGSTNTLAQLQQRIESTNAQEIAGKVVTFSIWAKNGLGAASNSTLTWSSDYPTTTDDWTTPISDQSGTFAATFTLGAWVRYSATFTVNALATRGYRIIIRRTQTAAEITETYFTGAQLEVGINVTPFRRNAPNIQAELAACQRYYEVSVASGTSQQYVGTGVAYTAGSMYAMLPFKVEKRIVPAAVISNGTNFWGFDRAGAMDQFSTLQAVTSPQTTRQLGVVFASAELAGTAGQSGIFLTQNIGASLAWNAEL